MIEILTKSMAAATISTAEAMRRLNYANRDLEKLGREKV